MEGECALCQRATEVTRHHLIPQSRHNKRRTRLAYDRDALKRRLIVPLCRPCHKQVHAVLTEKELAESYSKVELLLAHPEIAKFVAWVRKKPPSTAVPVRGMKR